MISVRITNAPVDGPLAQQLATLLSGAGMSVEPVGTRPVTGGPASLLVFLCSEAGAASNLDEVQRDVARAITESGLVAVVRTGAASLPTSLATLIGKPAPIDWRPGDATTGAQVCEAIRALATAAESASMAGQIAVPPPSATPDVPGGDFMRPPSAPAVVPNRDMQSRLAATVDSDAGPDVSYVGGGGANTPMVGTAVSELGDGLSDLRNTASIDAAPRPGLAGKIDRFEVVRVLGQGGMGVVLLARDPNANGATVAIKTIAARYVGNTRAQSRFVKEANNMKRMTHPNVLKVTECVNRPNGAYYVMPYIDAGSMARLLDNDEPADTTLLLNVAVQIADALRYAHDDAGVLHRDIKPENVLVDSSGHAYLSDFGLVRSLVVNETVQEGERGWTVGTARYMAPEIADGKAGDTRADIYSFGAMLYELATGVAPYEDTAPSATNERIIDRILHGSPSPVLTLNPSILPDLARLIEGAMARELRDRYAHMKDVLEDLKRIRRGLPIRGAKDAGNGSASGSGEPAAVVPASGTRSAAATAPGISMASATGTVSQPIAPVAAATRSSNRAVKLVAAVLVMMILLAALLAGGAWMYGGRLLAMVQGAATQPTTQRTELAPPPRPGDATAGNTKAGETKANGTTPAHTTPAGSTATNSTAAGTTPANTNTATPKTSTGSTAAPANNGSAANTGATSGSTAGTSSGGVSGAASAVSNWLTGSSSTPPPAKTATAEPKPADPKPADAKPADPKPTTPAVADAGSTNGTTSGKATTPTNTVPAARPQSYFTLDAAGKTLFDPQPADGETDDDHAKRAVREIADSVTRGQEDTALEELDAMTTLKQYEMNALSGEPLLNVAAEHGRVRTLRYLVTKRKFDINRVDGFVARTPLDCADSDATRKVIRDELGGKTKAELDRR